MINIDIRVAKGHKSYCSMWTAGFDQFFASYLPVSSSVSVEIDDQGESNGRMIHDI